MRPPSGIRQQPTVRAALHQNTLRTTLGGRSERLQSKSRPQTTALAMRLALRRSPLSEPSREDQPPTRRASPAPSRQRPPGRAPTRDGPLPSTGKHPPTSPQPSRHGLPLAGQRHMLSARLFGRVGGGLVQSAWTADGLSFPINPQHRRSARRGLRCPARPATCGRSSQPVSFLQ